MDFCRRWITHVALLLLPAIFFSALPAAAKGSVDKITIGGPLLDGEVEMADPAVLDSFSPWAGQYLGASGPLAEPPTLWDRVPYEVYFYLAEDGRMELSYVLYYYPDADRARPGYIYLPGSDEPYHAINAEVILSGNDGKWFNADPGWEAAVQEALARTNGNGPPAGDATNPSTAPAPWILTLLSAAVAGLLLWIRLH